MAIFAEFQPEEWAFFPFILGALSIFVGSISHFGDFFLAKGASQLFDLPLNLLIFPLVNSGSAVLAMLAVLAFVWYFGKVGEVFTPGFVAAILFGAIAIMLGA